MNPHTSTLTVPSDFLAISDLDEAQFAAALDLAEEMKHAPAGFLDALPAETLACFFEKPSTRTREK